MKINWGTGIAIFYGCFMLTFIGIAIKSTQYDVNMVKKDYYTDDINYQKHLDKIHNEQALTEKLHINFDAESETVVLKFPKNLPFPTGRVILFHPASDKDDKTFQIETDNAAQMNIPVKGLKNGRWQVQINWESGNKAFYKEEYIVIQTKV
jgi:hypothetical protein